MYYISINIRFKKSEPKDDIEALGASKKIRKFKLQPSLIDFWEDKENKVLASSPGKRKRKCSPESKPEKKPRGKRV